MPAYFVYLCHEIYDREELETYWRSIGSTLKGYEAKNIAAYTKFEVLEGDPVRGVAVVEFPSMEIARQWYDSPSYAEIRKHRQNGAKYTGLLVEGGATPLEDRMKG
jgi:uncharacterized protein (DUF1330 family)